MLAPFLGQPVFDTAAMRSSNAKARSAPKPPPPTAAPLEGDRLDKPLYTGRYLLLLQEEKINYKTLTKNFKNKLGAQVAMRSDFKTEDFSQDKLGDADVLVYEKLGLALIGAPQKEIVQFQESIDEATIVEPELVVYAPPVFTAVNAVPVSTACTWGISISRLPASKYTGKGVKVAVLDTGFDASHPDFKGRTVVSKSFIPGSAATKDVVGHGTHCIGTACGKTDKSGLRYGVAGGCDIYVGKVLDDSGRGAQSWIIDGIDWAAEQGCKVISMSLGSRAFPGLAYSTAYEMAAANAVSEGAVVIAAAGNDSNRRSQFFSPVSSPANCPSILAVAALSTTTPTSGALQNLRIANFSNRGINPDQLVDVAAAGVDVYSSWPGGGYKTISGTSMATPHVAGMAALLCEKYPHYTPKQITDRLLTLAQKLSHLPTADIGSGLAIAP